MSDSQKWLIFAGALVGIFLLYQLTPVFTPFVTAALLAYLADPLVDRLEALKLSRTLGVVVVFIALLTVLALILVWLVPLLEDQVVYLISRLPAYATWVNETVVPWLREHLGVQELSLDLVALQNTLKEHWQQAGGIAAGVVGSVTSSGMLLLQWVGNLVLIPVVTFYLLRDWDRLVQAVHVMIPRRHEPTVAGLVRESDEVLAAFLRGQFLVMIALGIIYAVGLWIVGLELAVLIGMLAGLVSFVPYLGFIVGVLSAGIAIVMQTHELTPLLGVLVVFGVGQVLESVLLTPLLVGDRIGLHPVAVIFALLAGGQLFGFVGVLLALPVAAVLAVLIRHVHSRYLDSPLYHETGS